jgi:hypothetical protein
MKEKEGKKYKVRINASATKTQNLGTCLMFAVDLVANPNDPKLLFWIGIKH